MIVTFEREKTQSSFVFTSQLYNTKKYSFDQVGKKVLFLSEPEFDSESSGHFIWENYLWLPELILQ